MAIATGMISSLLNITLFQDVPFNNHSCFNVCIMVLSKLTFDQFHLIVVYHYTSFQTTLSTLGNNSKQRKALEASLLALHLHESFTEDITGILQIVTYVEEDKGMEHKGATFKSMPGVRTSTLKHSIFSIMTGLILEMLFMLFSIYIAV